MWISVLQATSFSIASAILTYHLRSSMFQTVFEDDAFKAWLDVAENLTAPTTSTTAGLSLTLYPGQIKPINATNSTALTRSTDPLSEKPRDSFYSRELPRIIVVDFVLLILRYYWFIYLEKLLPARPRGQFIQPKGKEKSEENEFREE